MGEGSYSVVFRSFDEQEHRKVAIKEMKYDQLPEEEAQDAQQIFFNEINILKCLHHPNLPKVYDFFIFEGRHYMVMEWCEGRDLKSREDYYGDELISEREALDYMKQICDALIYLQHESRNVVYKDLKPSNIIVNRTGKVKLIDFGTARHYSPEKKKDTMVLGTPGYAPPEAYTGAQTDLSADVYSFGATFYHLLTGEEPFRFKFNFPDPRKFNPDLSSEISELLLDCLKNRDERIKDAFKLRKRVHAVEKARDNWKSRFELAESGSPEVSPMMLPAVLSVGLIILLFIALTSQGPETKLSDNGCFISLLKAIIPMIIASISMSMYLYEPQMNREFYEKHYDEIPERSVYASFFVFFLIFIIFWLIMLMF